MFAGLAAVAGAGESGETALLLRLFCFVLFQRVVRTLFCEPGEIGQTLVTQGAVDKEDHQQGKSQRGRVEDAANPAPAGLHGIVKNLFRHLEVVPFILRCAPQGVKHSCQRQLRALSKAAIRDIFATCFG